MDYTKEERERDVARAMRVYCAGVNKAEEEARRALQAVILERDLSLKQAAGLLRAYRARLS